MRSENFIVIQGWMRTELKLKGNDLMVYAIIYGFSQTENQKFTGSLQYLADWCGATKQGIMKNLKNLIDAGLIIKEERTENNVKFVSYYTTEFNGGIQLSLNNNIVDSKEVNKNTSKEVLQDFAFGNKKSTKKPNMYTKCVQLIDSYDFSCWGHIREQLIDYLNFRLSVKDKPLYTNMWKGMLNKLANLCVDDISKYEQVIQYSLERGYLSFYEPSNYSSAKSKPWESGVKSTTRTEEEKEADREFLAKMAAQGKKVVF